MRGSPIRASSKMSSIAKSRCSWAGLEGPAGAAAAGATAGTTPDMRRRAARARTTAALLGFIWNPLRRRELFRVEGAAGPRPSGRETTASRCGCHFMPFGRNTLPVGAGAGTGTALRAGMIGLFGVIDRLGESCRPRLSDRRPSPAGPRPASAHVPRPD
jgi:hypothetical protein